MASGVVAESELREKIFRYTAAPLLQWSKPDEPPFIGPEFATRLKQMEDHVERCLSSIQSWIDGQKYDYLLSAFDQRGVAIEETARHWQDDEYQSASRLVKRFSPAVAAAFGAPRLMADFDYWSKVAFFKLEEALWLSFGLEPTGDYNGKTIAIVAQHPELDPVDMFVSRQRELFQREFKLAKIGRPILPAELHAWIKRVGLEVHHGFERMLARMLWPEPAPESADDTLQSSAVEKQRKPDDREKRSLAKLLVAIAIQEYGYRPDQARSPIPKEMQDIADGLGLTVSRDTILKYLRLGALELPDDWRAGRD